MTQKLNQYFHTFVVSSLVMDQGGVKRFRRDKNNFTRDNSSLKVSHGFDILNIALLLGSEIKGCLPTMEQEKTIERNL